MKGLVKKLSFGLIIIAIVLIAVFNKQIRKTIRISQIKDPEMKTELTYPELTREDEKVDGTDNIIFSAFFLRDLEGDGIANKLKGTCNDVNGKPDTLYINFNILGDGKLKNARIELNQSNFKWNTEIIQDNIVASSYSGNVTSIMFKNEIIGGSQKLFSGSIYPNIKNNINNYTGINSVTLTGTYVDDDGIETPIRKNIDLTVDWYGTTKTIVNKNNLLQIKDIKSLISDEKVNVKFDAIVTETEEKLLLQKQVAEIEIPSLNGYEAINAYVNTARATSTYDAENKKLTITNSSNVKYNGVVQVAIARSNTYEVIIEYPMEAYEAADGGSISLDIPIRGYNYGYNNPNGYFLNPFVSSDSNVITVVYNGNSNQHEGGNTNPTETKSEWGISMSVGDFVYSSIAESEYRISQDTVLERYNGSIYEDIEDTYTVRWNAIIYEPYSIARLTLEEQTNGENKRSDDFVRRNNSTVSMREYEKTIGVSFKNAIDILGYDGFIKLYNGETDTLIETFTRDNWDNPYTVGINDLKSIKVVTSPPIQKGILEVDQIKRIDDRKIVEDFTREEFQAFKYINSYVIGTAEARSKFSNNTTESTRRASNYANYEGKMSVQNISISPKEISNQETKNVDIKISTKSVNDFESGWIDGVFLIELPEALLEVSVDNVTTNNNKVAIKSWSYYEENNKKYIKIYTSNADDEVFDINVNANITANPLSATKVETIELYAYNRNCNAYYYNSTDKYDLDEDLLTQDLIGYSTTTLTTIAPSGLLTTEYITNYDENNSISIAPNIAEIEKADGARTAIVNIELLDNYTGTIRDVSILGRIPYEGNRYILVDKDLKSKYTAQITGPITIPERHINDVTIYYSTNGNATKDINDINNEWITAENVTDWSTIKSYLIDFGDYVFTEISQDIFSYEVKIPSGVGYDNATYSNHAVFYSLDTQNGKLEMETEPNRVGMQVVGKYTLNLTKNKMGKNNILVPGATYRVVSKDANDNLISKIASTDENGTLTFNNMYIGREYTLEEISSPSDYILSEGKIVFNTSVNNQGELVVDIIHDQEHGESKDFKENPIVILDNNGNFVVDAKVEDEAKYTMTINKTDENNNPLNNTIFKFGTAYKTRNYITDANGQIVITGLELDEEYIIQEIRSDGYYVDENEKTFKLIRDENGLKIVTTDDVLANATIDNPDDKAQTQVVFNIKNEKIPTFRLQIVKTNKPKEGENVNFLEGAYFRVASIDTQKQEEYKTNENGIIEVDGLYLHVDGKNVTGIYEIQETRAPGGYINSSDLITIEVNGVYNEETQKYDLNVNVENVEQLQSVSSITVESDIVKIIVQDKPLFQLTKVDSETGEVLSDVEFVIYKMEDDGTTDFAKDEYGNYIGIKNDQGDYIVKTDENGVISLPLPDGKYCLVEVTYPEGYQVKNEAEYFEIGDDENVNENDDEDENKKINRVIEINYIEDLVELSEKTKSGDNYHDAIVKLMRNLDFEDADSYRSGNINWNLVEAEDSIGFTPIGGKLNVFAGIFDGQGYTISNLYGNDDLEYLGLFGKIDDAEIINLNVNGNVGCTLNYGNRNAYAGGIAAYSTNSKIENCSADMSFNIAENRVSYIGGIVGYANYGIIKNCYNTSNIEIIKQCTDYYANTFTGGVVGYAINIRIVGCYNRGNISGSNTCPANSYNTKALVYTNTGGIAGKTNTTDIENCYNTGDIYSYSYTQGFLEGEAYHDYIVKIGEANSGGIVGAEESGSISNCYNVGNITKSGVSDSKNYGIVGKEKESKKNNCYNLTGKGTSNETGVIQYTDEYMKSDDFVQDLGSKYWTKDENQNSGYPIQSGSSDEVLIINYVEDLVDFATDVNRGNTYEGKTVVLNRDLDFNDVGSYKNNVVNTSLTSGNPGFPTIGENAKVFFGGTFDGQNHVLNNIYINSNSDKAFIGLFGYIDHAEIKNLGVTGRVNVDYTISSNEKAQLSKTINVGSIVGSANYSLINNCYSLCVISNRVSVTNTKNSISDNRSTAESFIRSGGIVGISNYTIISNCYNMGNVAGTSISNCTKTSSGASGTCTSNTYLGGIVGLSSYSGIENCYNRGNINSYGSVTSSVYINKNINGFNGGIVGDTNNSSINKVYNTGNITSYSSNQKCGGISGYKENNTVVYSAFYLDTITISGTKIDIGETRTDEQMKSIDFVDELDGRYWILDENQNNDGYPIVSDELVPITEIYYIEDLVQLSNDVNAGITYKGINVRLLRNLDFNDAGSYRSGIVDPKLIEGNNSNGFMPIGSNIGTIFSGLFDGQGYEIRNIYINADNKYVGLFGCVDDGKIKNLGLTGVIKGNSSTYTAGIVAYAKNSSVISNCYNNATIIGKSTVGGVVGRSELSVIKNSNNTGSVEGSSNNGGIVGSLSSSLVECCYNIGNIGVTGDSGGIAGYSEKYSVLRNVYNTGKVRGRISVGGIIGESNATRILNAYNVGDITSPETVSYNGYAGSIVGSNKSTNLLDNCYYPETISVKGREIYKNGIETTNDYMVSKEFFNELNVDNVWMYRKEKYPILVNKQVKNIIGEATELTINNTIKKYKITTDIKEINNVKGGSISGEDENPYETINYNENNIKSISIIPDEGYLINSITINNEDIVYTPSIDGSYTIDAGYFSSVDEDKNIVVSFSPKDKTIYISKTDKEGNPLKDAEFSIESNNDTPVLGALTNNSENYYFVDNGNGYISNNVGQHSTCANSYIPLDLTNYQGKYNLTINAQVSSQNYYDYGYVTITKTIDAPLYNDSNGRLIYISGSVSQKDYSVELEGGNEYYIHLGYNKNSSTNSGTDCFTINSINVEPIVETHTALTNEEGIAAVPVSYLGKYKINETKAPEHYLLNDEEKNIELVSGESVQTVQFENVRKTEIVVHHYLEGTTSKVAEDDILYGEPGESYEARPHTDLDKLSVVENQEYYAGTFGNEGAEYIIYYKAAQVKLTIHHYYEGTEKSLVEDKVIYQNSEVVFNGEADYQVITDASYVLNTNEDYLLLKEDNEFIGVSSKNINRDVLTIEDSLEYNTDTELTYYYKLKEVNYKVQYFYNSVLDEEKTVYNTEVQDVTIESYEDKCLDGYKFDYVKALNENGEETEMPLTLRTNDEYNVINVYYISDDTQQKNIGYKVEYYKDGVKVEEDTQIKTAKVQLLENTMAVDKDDINIVDKYLGYKIDSTNPNPIPDTIEDGGIIKVYYVFDEDAKKELTYTVEYYKDNVKVEEDTITENIIVHVLQPDTLTVKMEEINKVDKYEGYVCVGTNPSTIPDVINTGSVIKVYYISVVDYKFEKKWKNKSEDEINLHRTTYRLYKNVDGTESTVTNSRRTITAIVNDATLTNEEIEFTSTSSVITVNVIGNGTVEFKNLPKYENGKEITYLVKETTITKSIQNGTSWIYPSMNNYSINYNDNYEGANRLVENTERFRITSEIAKNASNERTGGTITGEFTNGYSESNGKRYVETVNEGENAVNDIVIDPDEGYIITSLTINDNSYEFVPDSNGNVIIPKEYFQNMKENKHIIVKFVNTSKLIKLIKENEEGNRLQGAEFLVSNKNDYSSHVGAITADSDYEYYFEEMSDGSFASNNVGVNDSTARSYSDIDLSDLTGSFMLRVNISVSSESGYDIGSIELEDVESGSIENLGSNSGYEQNIICEATLQGGKQYRVYYKYSKDSSAEANDDRLYINNVSLFYGDDYTAVTDENGEAYIEVKSGDSFNVTETTAPNGYIRSDELKVVTVPSEVTFVNRAATYTITTEVGVNSLGERAGGTITGEYTEDYSEENFIKFVENVKGTQNAINDIVINPTSGYEVSTISINGANYTFEQDLNGNVVIPKSEFINVTNDKHIIVTFEEKEKEVTIIKTNKNSGKPLEGAKFRFTSNFERTINIDKYISNMYNDPGYNQYSFDYNESDGTYTSNNQNYDSTTAVGYKIIDLTSLDGEYDFIVNAEISSESNYDLGYVIVDEISSETAQEDISYDNQQNPYEMINIDGEISSQDYMTTLYGGNKYVIYFVYSKDGSSNGGTDTFKINSIGFESVSGPIIVETDLTDIEGKTTVKLRGYGEYTISEIVTPDGYITMDDMTFELSDSEDNQTINIQNERDGVINATYTVNYLEKGTDTVLETSKTSDEIEVDSTITITDEIISIDGYEYDSANVDSIIISENSEENVINLYYTKRNDLSYTVNYLDKDTNQSIKTKKQVPDMTYGTLINTNDEIVSIYGYNYDSSDKDSLTISTTEANNVINLYYIRKQSNVITKYLDIDTNEPVANQATSTDYVGETYTTVSSEQVPTYYELVETPSNATGEYTEQDIIVTYYYRLKNYGYTVEYYYNNVKDDDKTVEEIETYGNQITTYTDKNITGYKFDKVENLPLTIGDNTSENVVKVYYVKDNFNYTVEYYYDNVKDDTKTYTNSAEFESVISTYPDKSKDGYRFDRDEGKPLTITENADNNVIKVYYVIRNDLSYEVNYLDKDTNQSIKTKKQVPDMTYGTVINTNDEIVSIYGYDYDSADKNLLTIGTDATANVINLYYTRKQSNVITKYLDVDTNEPVANQTTSTDYVGETYTTTSSVDVPTYYELVETPSNATGEYTEEDITVTYYYRLKNYDYTVKYYYDGVIDNTKTENGNAKYGTTISEYTDKNIVGHKLDKTENLPLTIGENVSSNEIRVYYVRDTYGYTVEYYYDNVKDNDKTENLSGTFGTEINTYPDKCIDGYRLNSVDSIPMIITEDASNNVIKVYYVKRSDLSYVVNYLEKGTDNVIETQKYVEDVTYGDVINSADEVKTIYGYNYDSADKESITISTTAANNVINLYYTKKAATVLVHYYIENTENKVPSTTEGETVEDVTLNGLVGDEYTATEAQNVSNKYELVSATPENYTGDYTEDEIVVTYYYRLKDASVVVHHYIENTTTNVPSNVEGEVVEDETKNGKVDDEYQTSAASNVSSIYELVETPSNANGIMTVDQIDVYYYYKLKNYEYTIEYYYNDVKDDDKTVEGTETYGNQITEYTDKNITGYKFDKVENLPLTISDNTSENVVKVYYVKDNFNYTVEYYYDDVKDDTVTYTTSAEFESVINSYPDGSRDGYRFVKDEGKPLTITENAENNLIKVYYVTRTDLSYVVNYLEKDTNNVIETQKYAEDITYGDVINAIDEVITIYGYDYDSADKETLTISTKAANNVINLYYTKKDAKVTAKYVLENTETEVAEPVDYTGKVGDTYTTSPAENVEDKYELISETPTGYTGEYTEDDIEVIYYYRLKDTSVLVHHYIQDNDGNPTTISVPSNVEGEVVGDETKTGKVDDEYHTTAAININENYELVSTPRNADGTMSVDQIVVTYYYALKSAKAVARYVDLYAEIVELDDTDEIAERQTKTGKIGDEYETDQKEIEGYTFIRSTNNTEGTLTLEDIDVVYYYAPNTYVTVRYLEKGSNEVLSPEVTKEGFAGKEFETEEETIDNYTLVEVDGPVSGTMTKAPITTTYYYLQNTKARVEYIDITDNHIMEWREQTGLVGDEFVTEAKEFENYVLVESPEQTTINMAKDMITLRYYYVYANAGLIERHINVLTGAILASEEHGNKTEGTAYKIDPRDIEGYELVTELNGTNYLPDNSEGTYGKDLITVDYYYIRKASVTARYIDKMTDEELAEDVVINGYENDPYQTEEKEFNGYILDSVDGNTNSIMNITTDEDGNVVTNKVVTYYYKKASTVIVNHIDVNTDEILSVERKNGYEGDNYLTTAKKIKSYDLVEDRLPENKDGKYARDEQVVNYYYIKKLTVVVEYLDKITGARLAVEDKIEGHEGDTYTTTPKELLGYEVVGVPKNAAGEMKVEEKEDGIFENEIRVTYYYKIPCRVVVEYIDKETGKKLTTSTAIEGYENDEYETKAKEFAGYELIQEPENAKGIMKVQLNENKETTEIIVRYYYAKKATGTLPQTGEDVAKKVLYASAFIANISLAYVLFKKYRKGDKEN